MRARIAAMSMAVLALLTSPSWAQEGAQIPPPAPTTEAVLPPAEASNVAPLTHENVEAWLDGYVPYALQTSGVAGAVVVVVKGGQVLVQKGYGYSDVAARKPVDPELTLFRPGSISKLFTWTAVMQQVEQGKLDLDADVNQYLDFKIPER
ncbi:serine hydrolase, partial [Steroidobacter sp.]|uniref:serine hydrolase n=1 Tax=Steroidobacter sp. TaxID=1978227 RepID=UPI001A60C1C1